MIAEDERDAAIDQVEANADAEFFNIALDAVMGLALVREEFTTDDLMECLTDTPVPREPRVFGAVMRSAARSGWVTASDRYTASSRRQSHARPKRVWVSLLN